MRRVHFIPHYTRKGQSAMAVLESLVQKWGLVLQDAVPLHISAGTRYFLAN